MYNDSIIPPKTKGVLKENSHHDSLAFAFYPDHRSALIGTRCNGIVKWDMEAGTLTALVDGEAVESHHIDRIGCLADGSFWVASCRGDSSKDARLRRFSADGTQMSRLFLWQRVRGMVVAENGDCIVSGGSHDQTTVKRVSAETGEVVWETVHPDNNIMACDSAGMMVARAPSLGVTISLSSATPGTVYHLPGYAYSALQPESTKFQAVQYPITVHSSRLYSIPKELRFSFKCPYGFMSPDGHIVMFHKDGDDQVHFMSVFSDAVFDKDPEDGYIVPIKTKAYLRDFLNARSHGNNCECMDMGKQL
ncbi:hypothetical protein KIPB_005166 [Kipferlia bialata]|uniref:Uncharacterized protein n=1 Tax=Kipferlia bialata TaxID=797122 RepID=A0A9K3CY52_9EUKA|nr:hypothetical protein KIPB_005166 [Kipferlia bialata]|eukprot:g5166.t1